MKSTFPSRGSSIPTTFNPGSNGSVDAGGLPPPTTPPKDRLVVGVDFGTTYSGTYTHCNHGNHVA